MHFISIAKCSICIAILYWWRLEHRIEWRMHGMMVTSPYIYNLCSSYSLDFNLSGSGANSTVPKESSTNSTN